MNKLIRGTMIGLTALLMAATPAFADSTKTTKSTWYCYTNSYGQETCTENKEETETFEKVVVRELSKEEAVVINQAAEVAVVEHIPLDTALTPAQIVPLMGMMTAAITAVGYKLKKAE